MQLTMTSRRTPTRTTPPQACSSRRRYEGLVTARAQKQKEGSMSAAAVTATSKCGAVARRNVLHVMFCSITSIAFLAASAAVGSDLHDLRTCCANAEHPAP